MHFVFLLEEQSMEAFLRTLLPRLLPEPCSHEVHAFRSKSDLRRKVAARLRGYSKWLPDDWRIFVLLDRDGDDCEELKDELEVAARRSGLRTISRGGHWQLANRIVIEELEALVLRQLAGSATSLPAGIATHSGPCGLSGSGRHYGYVGSVRAHSPETWVLHERTAKDGSGPGDRRAHRSRGESLRQFLRVPPYSDGGHPRGRGVTGP